MGFLVCVLTVFGFFLVDAHKAWRAEKQWLLAAKFFNIPSNPQSQAALVDHASKAVRADSANAEYLHWLNVYRWKFLERVLAEGEPGPQQLQTWHDLSLVMVTDLQRVRKLCLTYARAYHLEGILWRAMGDPDRGNQLIRQSYRLAPMNPHIAWTAGIVEAESGDFHASRLRVENALLSKRHWFTRASDLYIDQFNQTDMAVELAGEDYNRLSHLAGKLARIPEHAELAEILQRKTIHILRWRCEQPGASASDLAHLAAIRQRQGETEQAIKYYARALDLAYDQIEWRIERARLLAESKRLSQAMRELKICLRIHPQHPLARRLHEELVDQAAETSGTAQDTPASP